jgi:TolB-like protein
VKNLKSFIVVVSLTLGTISCSSITDLPYFTNEGIAVQQSPRKIKLHVLAKQQSKLDYYVRTLTHELVSNMTHVKPDSVLASSSFVYVDGDFLSMPTFAKQLQEGFTYEFHKIGQPIVEFKSTGFIRITREGDFALSKDFTELDQVQPIDYILLGTLTELMSGVQVNAKLVGVRSHAVVAVAQITIPQEVIDNIIPSTIKGQQIKIVTH